MTGRWVDTLPKEVMAEYVRQARAKLPPEAPEWLVKRQAEWDASLEHEPTEEEYIRANNRICEEVYRSVLEDCRTKKRPTKPTSTMESPGKDPQAS